ncbi:paraquat-inducible protein B [mine drainage metagenome]|uniref:Paraquat-inducible protein B n=1 Tax=mine drainage metagenome TaxID=410659 RepID=A0A1J5S888_9ZZZZ
MKTKVSPAVVGFFVLGALALGLIALLSFGGVNFFSKPQRFVVFFNESVHGLDLGSPVKLRGVRVGRVVDMNIRYNSKTDQAEVAVVCELSRNMIVDQTGKEVDVTDRRVIQQFVKNGLRAQLGVVGLATGLLFVELDFYNPAEYPATPPLSDGRFEVVPSVPSAISEYQASLTEILSDLRRVDFAALSKELQALLIDTRKQVDKADLRELITEWTKAAKSVQTLATSPQITSAIAHFDQASQQMNSVLEKVGSQVNPTSDKLAATLVETKRAAESLNATAAELRHFVEAQQHVGGDVSQTLQHISDAADAVQRLADFLERNPNAVLSGRKGPE